MTTHDAPTRTEETPTDPEVDALDPWYMIGRLLGALESRGTIDVAKWNEVVAAAEARHKA
jgi:hypothetical protein